MPCPPARPQHIFNDAVESAALGIGCSRRAGSRLVAPNRRDGWDSAACGGLRMAWAELPVATPPEGLFVGPTRPPPVAYAALRAVPAERVGDEPWGMQRAARWGAHAAGEARVGSEGGRRGDGNHGGEGGRELGTDGPGGGAAEFAAHGNVSALELTPVWQNASSGGGKPEASPQAAAHEVGEQLRELLVGTQRPHLVLGAPAWLIAGFDGVAGELARRGAFGFWGEDEPPAPLAHFVGAPCKPLAVRAAGWWERGPEDETLLSRIVAIEEAEGAEEAGGSVGGREASGEGRKVARDERAAGEGGRRGGGSDGGAAAGSSLSGGGVGGMLGQDTADGFAEAYGRLLPALAALAAASNRTMALPAVPCGAAWIPRRAFAPSRPPALCRQAPACVLACSAPRCCGYLCVSAQEQALSEVRLVPRCHSPATFLARSPR